MPEEHLKLAHNLAIMLHAFAYENLECFALYVFFFQAEDGIRDLTVTGVQTCALPISGEAPDDRSAGRGDVGPRGQVEHVHEVAAGGHGVADGVEPAGAAELDVEGDVGRAPGGLRDQGPDGPPAFPGDPRDGGGGGAGHRP